MIHCEGEGCSRKSECQRYIERKNADLISRVLCMGGLYSWFVRIE